MQLTVTETEVKPARLSPVNPTTAPLFSVETCESLITYAEAQGFERGNVGEDGGRPVAAARQNDVLWLDPSFGTIYEQVLKCLSGAAAAYGFEISGVQPLQIARYQAGEFYDWHIDLGSGGLSTRKLSLSVQLSDEGDYSGGDLEFEQLVAPRTRGLGILFPAYLRHRVCPVTEGVRYSLVAWTVGPLWR